MKYFNVLLCLIMFFSLNLYSMKKSVNALIIPKEIWQKIAGNMGSEGLNLTTAGKKFLSFNDESFKEDLETYRKPYLEKIAKKEASTDLRRSVFNLSKPKFQICTILDKQTKKYELSKKIIKTLRVFYDRYIKENYGTYVLTYTNIKNLDKELFEENNLSITCKKDTINEINIEIFENKNKKAIKILEGQAVNFSLIQAIKEKYSDTVRIVDIPELNTPEYYALMGNGINVQNQNGNTFLHEKINKNDFNYMESSLKSHKMDLNIQNIKGETPLILAVGKNKLEIVKLLLEYGSDLNVPNDVDEYPLYIACLNNNLEMVKLLLEKSADINAKNANEDTSLHDVVVNENQEIVKLLLKKGANVNIQNNKGDTPLHCAVLRNKEETIKLLLEHGANQEIKNNNNDTPRAVALDNGKLEFAKLIFSYFIKFNNNQIN